eukprot:6465276-Amphidinium_carterae.1
MANRLGWVPNVGGWTRQGQWFSWDEATVLCAQVAITRTVFEGLAAGPLPLTLRLEECGAKSVRTLYSKSETLVSGAEKLWRILSTLFTIARTGTKSAVSPACRRTRSRPQRACACVVSYWRHRQEPAPPMNQHWS